MNQNQLEQLFPTIFINSKIDLLHFVSVDIGYGVYAVSEIEQGELLVEIPFTECILASDQKCLAQKISDYQKDSKWSEYISFIIDSGVLEKVPIMWENKRGICGSFKFLLESISADLPDVPKWASAYMLSRSFELEDSTDSIASVPVADLFNHSTINFQTRIRQCETGFRFYAESPIQAGCEIFNNYGIDDTLTMMATHGFYDKQLISNLVYIPIDDDVSSMLRIPVDEDIKITCRDFSERILIATENMLDEVKNCLADNNSGLDIVNESQLENLQTLYDDLLFH